MKLSQFNSAKNWAYRFLFFCFLRILFRHFLAVRFLSVFNLLLIQFLIFSGSLPLFQWRVAVEHELSLMNHMFILVFRIKEVSHRHKLWTHSIVYLLTVIYAIDFSWKTTQYTAYEFYSDIGQNSKFNRMNLFCALEKFQYDRRTCTPIIKHKHINDLFTHPQSEWHW